MQTGRTGLVIVKEKNCRFSLACILHRLHSSDVHSFLSTILPLPSFIIWEINARFSMQNGGLCMTHSTTISNWNPYYLTITSELYCNRGNFFEFYFKKNPHSLCQTPYKKLRNAFIEFWKILPCALHCIALHCIALQCNQIWLSFVMCNTMILGQDSM